MSEVNPIVRLLVNEAYRTKAAIKYETRQLEVRLKRITEIGEGAALQHIAREKPPVMWLDAIFQSLVKSWRVSAVKQTITSRKREALQTTNVRIEQLFNEIAAQQQEAVFFGKNAEDD